MKNKSGFTLLELLVVVLIIGILAAIALPQYKMAVAKSKFAALKNNVRALYEAEQRYYLSNGYFALNKSGLDIDVDKDCYVTPCCDSANSNSYVGCKTHINGTYVAYLIWFIDGHKTCLTEEVNDMGDVTNRLCKAESGDNTPYGGSTSYQYDWH